MLYTIYQVTHLESGKYYIGKHQTLDPNDGYMGSGKRIRAAIKKHGVEAFQKEVLHVFETEAEMNAKEAELVTEEFCKNVNTYNLCPGGEGGWGFINTTKANLYGSNGKLGFGAENLIESNRRHHEKMKMDPSYKALVSSKVSGSLKAAFEAGMPNGFEGKKHSDETRKKIGEKNATKAVGAGNSQFGSVWITDGRTPKKINKIEPLPDGYRYGRKIDGL